MIHTLNELMEKRAKIVEYVQKAQISMYDIEKDIVNHLIENNMIDFFTINYKKLSRIANVESDQMIRRRVIDDG